MYALFIRYTNRWEFREVVATEYERDQFVAMVQDMIKAPMLGPQIVGYDVHELNNQHKPETTTS